MREFTQAGVELIGAPAPEGTAEVIEVLRRRSTRPACDRAVIGLGDADLYRQLLAELGVEGEARDAHPRAPRDARPRRPRGRGRRRSRASSDEQRETLLAPAAAARRPRGARARRASSAARRSSARRAAAGDLRRAGARAASPTASSSTSACCATSATTRGAILEVYDPALGHMLGGGGRYDGLLGRFGRDLPAAGFALYLERVHVAQAEEERLTSEASRR